MSLKDTLDLLIQGQYGEILRNALMEETTKYQKEHREETIAWAITRWADWANPFIAMIRDIINQAENNPDWDNERIINALKNAKNQCKKVHAPELFSIQGLDYPK